MILAYQFEQNIEGKTRAVIYNRSGKVFDRRPWQETMGTAQTDAFKAAYEFEQEHKMITDLFGARMIGKEQTIQLIEKEEVLIEC